MRALKALPLTRERFAPFGQVIESAVAQKQAMNASRFERYADLATVDTGDGRVCVSIARCRTATTLPYRVDMLERHPDGSQAFVPVGGFKFLVVVAPAAESVDADQVVAFVSNGRQGINYAPGVWHMPMIAEQAGQEFLVIDRFESSCDEYHIDPPCMVSI